MSFICIRIRNHYQINCVALSLALKQRFEATLPIYYLIIVQAKKLFFILRTCYVLLLVMSRNSPSWEATCDDQKNGCETNQQTLVKLR